MIMKTKTGHSIRNNHRCPKATSTTSIAFSCLASPCLTSPDQTDMHPSNSRDAHQRLNEEKRIKNRCRRKNISRTYDAQTRKKINKYAVAAITVLPSAMFPSIRMKSPYNNNTSRQQPKLNILFLSLSFSLFYVPFHSKHFITTFFCMFFSLSIFIALIAGQANRSFSIACIIQNFKLEHGAPYSKLLAKSLLQNMKGIIFMIYAISDRILILTHTETLYQDSNKSPKSVMRGGWLQFSAKSNGNVHSSTSRTLEIEIMFCTKPTETVDIERNFKRIIEKKRDGERRNFGRTSNQIHTASDGRTLQCRWWWYRSSLIKSIPYNYHLGLHFEEQKCNFSIKYINASASPSHYAFMSLHSEQWNTPCAHFSNIIFLQLL